jgi:Tol biopolymer transport system component
MIDERELREMLERRAGTISATPTDAPKAIRRARRRLARNAAVGTLVGIAVLAGAIASVRTIQAAPTPADLPRPAPTPARLGALAYAVEGDIFVAEWDGSNPVRIADGRPPRAHGEPYVSNDCGVSEFGSGEYHDPTWSPDGRYLAYRQADCDGAQDGWDDVVISDPQGNVVSSFPSEGWGISWSPDSTRVAVWVRWPETIGVYGLDAERQTLLTLPHGFQWGEDDPVWSSDGGSLLLGLSWEIPLDGSAPRQLPWADLRAAWETLSPDGSRIAYTTRGSFVVAEADGSNPQEVFGDWAAFPVWSPSGDRIAFVSNPEGNGLDDAFVSSGQLRVLDVATGTVTLLTESEGSEWISVIEFSPEGDRVLFSRTEDGGSRVSSVWSVNADGSNLRRLVTGTAWGDWLSLSPMP